MQIEAFPERGLLKPWLDPDIVPATKTRNRALDGLRGLAVAAVVVNHLAPGGLRGGWLGVDVFFVLSGYLITTVLLREHDAQGRVGLRGFYARRVRRLLPALVLVLVGVSIAARAAPNTPGFADVRGDGASALLYVANWHFIATGAAYFNAFTPSPLRHLWSLSVEEQFYLLWPLVLILLMKRFDRRAVGVVALVLAGASAVAMAVVYGDGAHVSRSYFGTDTHAHGVLLGCALGVVGHHVGRLRFPRVIAAAGLVGLAVAFVVLDGNDAIAYRGGIAAVGLLATVVVAALVASDGRGPAAWLLQRGPLVGLGLISYGVYLWHWPVLEIVTSDRAGVSGWLLVTLQLLLTLLLALASYVLVERPVLAGWPGPRFGKVAAPAAIAGVAVALAVVVPVVTPPFAAAAHAARARSASPAEVRALSASRPGARRVVVVGDSVAYTLFPGFVAHERGSGLAFLDEAASGCPLGIDVQARRNDGETAAPEHLPESCDWRRTWPPMLRTARPDLVVALWGLWDVYDVEIAGRWLRVGSPAWNRYMTKQLSRAVDLLDADGAHVVLLTTPYLLVAAGRRVDALNAVIRAVAAHRPRAVTVVDTQSPTNALAPERWDSVHYTERGADALAGALVPEIRNARPDAVR